MPIKVACRCGQQFAAKDELAGKTVKCPQCSQPLTIPRPQAAAVGGNVSSLLDEAGMAAATTAARCPSCSAVLPDGAVLCVQCGYNAKTGRRMSTIRVSETGEEEPLEGVIPTTGNMLLDKASRELRKEEVESAKQWTGMPWWALLIMLIAMIVFTVTMMVIPPAIAMMISMIMFLSLFVIAQIAMKIWLIMIAFSESATCGLLYLFLPFYSVYFWFTRWDQCAAPVIILWLLSFLDTAAFAALIYLVPMLADSGDEYSLQMRERPAVVAAADPAEFNFVARASSAV